MTLINATSIDDAWAKTISYILANGIRRESRVGDQIECIGMSIRIADPQQRVLLNRRRAMKQPYASAELLWCLAGEDKIARLLPYAPSYGKFTEDGITAYGAYGARIMPAIKKVYAELTEKPLTRQAVATTWAPKDIDAVRSGTCKDVPCLLTFQFLLRDGRLHMVVNMRANDVWLGMPYDCFCFMSIQCLLARALNVELGEYIHTVGSMQIYTKHEKSSTEALLLWEETMPPDQLVVPNTLSESEARAVLLDDGSWYTAAETAIRSGLKVNYLTCKPSWMRDLVLSCDNYLRPNLELHQLVQTPSLFQEIK